MASDSIEANTNTSVNSTPNWIWQTKSLLLIYYNKIMRSEH